MKDIMQPVSTSFSGRRITALAAIATSASIGLTIGAYSISVLAIQSAFGTSLALSSLGLSLALLTLGMFPPIVVKLQERFSIRATMIAGAAIAAGAYVVLAFITSIWALLAIYALVIGPSTVLFGQFASSVLVSNWYIEGRGRVLGLIGMPVLIMLVPLGAEPVLAHYGLRTLFLALAAAHVLLIPILTQVVDRPEQIGESPHGNPVGEPALAAGRPAPTMAYFVRRLDFWLLVLGVGILNGSGISKISHLAAIIREQGHTFEQAAVLLAVSGGSGIFGSLVFGWVADRLGGAATLVINAGLQVATWSILLFHQPMPMLVLDGVIMGSCGAGVYCLVAVVCSQLYEPANIGRSLAFVNAFSTPLLFVVAPIVGAVHDRTGSYLVPILGLMGACAIAAAMFFMVIRTENRMLRQSRLEIRTDRAPAKKLSR
jgi:MFS family permease